MDHPETSPPRDLSHIQLPNPDTIAYARKLLLTGPWYSCLLWGYTSAWQIQKWILTVIYWMEHRVPNEGARESTQGTKRVCKPIGGTTIWTKQYPWPDPQFTHSIFLALTFPCTGAYDLCKTKDLSFQWWLTRPSSPTYATRDTHSGGYWLVRIVVPHIGLQTPLAPWLLSLAPSLGVLCSIQ